MKYAIALVENVAQQAQLHLRRADGDEDICFALWEPSRGRTRTTAIVTELILPHDGDRIVRGNVSFTPPYFERAMALARARGAGLAMMHSHLPSAFGWQGLSPDDHHAESGVAPPVSAATGLPLVGMTLAGGDAYWSGRFWERRAPRTYDPSFCDAIRIVGDALRADFYDGQRPPPAPRRRLARTISAWGALAQQHLARLHVGVVGVGSVGSIIVEALARTGIQRVSLLDFDALEEVNLDRTLHGYEEDVEKGMAKAVVSAHYARRSATADGFVVEPHEFSVCEEDGYRIALDCDVLFSCVDRPWPRSVLNFIAYAHLIPVIDGGIHVSRTRNGKMRGAEWKAHIAGPGHRCLACLGQYDPGFVQTEREGHLDDSSYIERLPVDHPLRCNENVFSFSLAAASLEMLQFLSMVIGPAGVHKIGAQTYHMAVGTLDKATAGCEDGCVYPELIGRGERAGHPGTADHDVAVRARSRRQ